MNSTSRSTAIKYIVFILVAVGVLVAFNTTRRPPKSDAQYRYNEWFNTVEVALRPGLTPPPPIAVKLATAGPGLTPATWEIRTGTTTTPEAAPQAREHMHRILQLVHESAVFGIDAIPEEDTVTARYKLTIDHGENHFLVAVPTSYVSGNIQAQNLMKLIQLYAATAPTTVAVPGQL